MRKTSEQREEINLRDTKRTADLSWDQIYKQVISGKKIDQQIIALNMQSCNNADQHILSRGYNLEKEI